MPTVGQMLQEAQRKRAAGDARAAEALFRRALDAEPHSAIALAQLGALLAQTGRAAQAEPFLRAAAEAEPRVAAHLVRLGGALQSQGKFADAVETLRRACALEGRNAEARAALAAACELSGRLDEAREAALGALRLRPALPMAERTLAKLDLRAEQWDAALARLEPLSRRAEVGAALRAAATLDMGQALDRLGRAAEAFDACTRAKSLLADTPEFQRFDPRAQVEWIGACVRWCDALSAPPRWQAPPDAAGRPAPVLFVGFLRSGTTLLEQMLDTHGALVTSNETPLLPAALAAAIRRAGAGARFPAMLDSMTDDDVRAARRAYWDAAERALGVVALASRGLIDKMALNITSLPLARRLWPEARVIVAVRDPRDVCLSCLMQNFRPDFTSVHFRSIDSTARYYAMVMGLWLRYRERLGMPWLQTRYEDLVADPEAALRRVTDFLEISFDARALDHAPSAKKKTITTPGSQAVTKPIYSHASQRWRRYEQQLECVQTTLSPFVSEFGYD